VAAVLVLAACATDADRGLTMRIPRLFFF